MEDMGDLLPSAEGVGNEVSEEDVGVDRLRRHYFGTLGLVDDGDDPFARTSKTSPSYVHVRCISMPTPRANLKTS